MYSQQALSLSREQAGQYFSSVFYLREKSFGPDASGKREYFKNFFNVARIVATCHLLLRDFDAHLAVQ